MALVLFSFPTSYLFDIALAIPLVSSDPDILAKEMEHLNRVLHYNNYPQWLINKWGKSDKQDCTIHPEMGVEIQKRFYIWVPYYLGLSESYKKIFKYTPIQVCFKGGEHPQIC